MTFFEILKSVANQGLPLFLGAVGGGIVSGWVTWRMLRGDTARKLLAEALTIQSEKEAWILEGTNYEMLKLSELKNLQTMKTDSGPWLRQVEIRAALDEARWTAVSKPYYDFIEGRRVWIVRNHVNVPRSHNGALDGGWHPALLSSRALEKYADENSLA